MADKSKQHWQKVQERKKRKKAREQAEIDRLMRKIENYRYRFW